MNEIISKSLCSGCGACKNKCPKQCISMIEDDEGFFYPQIDEKLCLDCNLCKSVCPILNKKIIVNVPNAYAVVNKNAYIRENSSSGGAFYLLAKFVIETGGGVVFGAMFNENFQVVHGYVETIEDIDKLMRSKYVQSTIGDMYEKAKHFLEEGRVVLFSGTPCQIGGLHAFLGRKYDNLLTQDLICHGVPSPLVWKKYLEYRKQQAKSKVRKISFRKKQNYSRSFFMYFEFENGKHYLMDKTVDMYVCSFIKDLTLRPSCYNCSFKTPTREADITLADFWGISKVAPEMDDGKGVSLVIIHSEKGMNLFDNIKELTIFNQVDFNKAISGNPNMTSSVFRKKDRDVFIKEIAIKRFDIVAKKYCREKFLERVKRKLMPLYRKMRGK